VAVPRSRQQTWDHLEDVKEIVTPKFGTTFATSPDTETSRANRGTGASVRCIPNRLRRRSDIQSHCRSFGARSRFSIEPDRSRPVAVAYDELSASEERGRFDR